MKYEINKKLKELRKENKITQKELGKILNKSPTAIASWEQGLSEPGIEEIRKICTIYKISADYLLGLEDEFKTPTKEKNTKINGYIKITTK